MAFGVAIFGSVQAVVIASGPDLPDYLAGLRVTLLIARSVACADRGRFHVAVSEATGQLK